jgi:hypothetical protein
MVFKFFHKHKSEKISCPFTLMTYTKCIKCGKHLSAPTRTELNGEKNNR